MNSLKSLILNFYFLSLVTLKTFIFYWVDGLICNSFNFKYLLFEISILIS
jgi:hypothetical protein